MKLLEKMWALLLSTLPAGGGGAVDCLLFPLGLGSYRSRDVDLLFLLGLFFFFLSFFFFFSLDFFFELFFFLLTARGASSSSPVVFSLLVTPRMEVFFLFVVVLLASGPVSAIGFVHVWSQNQFHSASVTIYNSLIVKRIFPCSRINVQKKSAF